MVIWSRPAMNDMRAIHDFIARDSPFHAKNVVENIREKTDILEHLPRVGKKVPELNDDAVRELSLYSYRMIYEIKDNGICVLAVVHKRLNLKAENIK